MKNRLIPIQPCSSTHGEWEPSPVAQGSGRITLVNCDGALRIRTGKKHPQHHTFTFRTDLGGLVHHGGYLPVIQAEEAGTFFIQNPDDDVVAAFNEAKNSGTPL